MAFYNELPLFVGLMLELTHQIQSVGVCVRREPAQVRRQHGPHLGRLAPGLCARVHVPAPRAGGQAAGLFTRAFLMGYPWTP
jgi:hypothetical protein